MKNVLMRFRYIYIALLLFVSCGTFQKKIDALKKCEVSLKDFKIKDYQAFGPNPGINFIVYISIFNPNDFQVSIYHFDMNIGKMVDKEEIRIANVHTPGTLKIDGMDYGVLEIEMKTDPGLAKNLGKTIKSIIADLLMKKNPVFAIDGDIKLDSVFGKIDIPVKFTQEAILQ